MTTPLEALRDMVAYIRKVGGYMTAEDQIKLRDAEQVLRDSEWLPSQVHPGVAP